MHELIRVVGMSIALCGLAAGAEPAQFKGNAMVPDAAKTLHEKGREAGQRGDLSRAVALFTQAAPLRQSFINPSGAEFPRRARLD